jgi:formylglycine-generating enzyme required for sulfatase activity
VSELARSSFTLLATCVLFVADCSRDRVLHPPQPLDPATVVSPSMVAVPAGDFLMGSNDGDDDERPEHRVEVASFAIDRTEVTVRAYRACVTDGTCSPAGTDPYCNGARAHRDEQPINCVDWEQAARYCTWRHQRLPTEAEWEYAARGRDGRMYPWGDARPAGQLCWDGQGSDTGAGKRRGTCKVGAHPAGRSAFGVDDMAGNVWEWVADFYTPAYGAPPTDLRVLRGGTWFGYDRADVRSSLRFRTNSTARDYGIGFRCATSI